MAGQQRPIGSKPTPRDPQTEKVRDQTTKGNPFGPKYGGSPKKEGR
jgi:hypothetical protein